MAKSYYSLGCGLSRAEAIAGWCYLPFYLVLLSAGIQYLAALLHVSLTALTINIVYFSINLLFVLLVFRNFLLQRFFGSGFWNFVQALILGFVLYYAGTWAIQALEQLLAGQFTIYNNETVNDLIFENRYVMLAVSVIFAPVIEETLVRGVVFGTIRPASRVLGLHRLGAAFYAHAQLAVFWAPSVFVHPAQLSAIYSGVCRAGVGL